jgi:exopolyphosphatase/guanosine-5'-triphosphate,3'-diphosphate pyrophosphatase
MVRCSWKKSKKNLAWDISLINGFQEAEFIAKGVTHAIPDLQNEPYLIIDIGGGSIEFIIAQEGQVIWKGSFLIGVALCPTVFNTAIRSRPEK